MGLDLWGFETQGFFILDIIYTYLVAYYFSPKYLERKMYFNFTFSILILTLFTYILFVLNLLGSKGVTNRSVDEQLLAVWFFSMNFIINGPPVICAMFLTFKMLKNYYKKMEEKAALINETSNAELQLLKAQIHPHFLFNTLNNIYSFNLNKSPQAASLVLQLSDTLKYMVNDCEAELVPLEMELKMLQNYMSLEKVRYGKRLKMDVVIKGDYQNKLIAPLLLIPFVENSFKHGSSKMLEHPWIELQVSIEEQFLDFKISNSKPSDIIPANGNNGIGLSNVKKRLDLLYPHKYSLKISEDIDEFCVVLKLPLQKAESPELIYSKQLKSETTLLTV